ncbi:MULTISPECIES: LysR family transcriptional regulator [unclassified Rhodosalinus]|uniref:LysR family transcriptional regulator n=1 Tax=unclassified Rhodosalinus TaxID=2630183 RepID=UPI003524D14C
MSSLNYHHLRYFHAVAHDGNLTRTAERLNLSQSALSTQIRKLEERLGHRLFDRRGRQLVLTEAGRIALDHADEIFAAGDELVDTLKAAGRARRALRVGAMATLSRNFTLGFLRPLLGRADVEIVLRSGSPAELMQGLATLNLDVALLNRAAAEDAVTPFVSHRLDDQPVSLVGTPARLAGERDPAALLAREPVILPTAESPVRTGFDALCDRLGIRPQIAAEVDDMAMMRLMARADAGLAVLPSIVVTDELSTGVLKEAQTLAGITEAFHAVTLERRFPNPLLPELIRLAARPRAG